MREYDRALRKKDFGAAALLEEITQLNVVRTELNKVGTEVRLGHGSWAISAREESITVEALFRRMDKLARQIAESPREDPVRHRIINELTGLTMLSDSLAKGDNTRRNH